MVLLSPSPIRAAFAAGVFATMLAAGSAVAACGLCAEAVTLDSRLAACFLERFDDFAARDGAAVAVDLDDCERERGVVEALVAPTGAQLRPDTRFIVTRAQLSCLKTRLEAPGAALDPLATVRLDDCG